MAQDQKQDAIIQAALKRFTHFGVGKTTMSEIASDLAISKASLYYYFPDKLNLYAAVLQFITAGGEKGENKGPDPGKDPFKAIQHFLETRTEFIIKYHNILEFLKDFQSNRIPAELQPVFSHLRKQELDHITSIIQKGREAGLLKVKDARRTAELFYEFLIGFRNHTLHHIPNLFPDKKQFQAILKKEAEFAAIFFKGLTI